MTVRSSTGSMPYFPLYVGEVLAATVTWDGEERALYLLLLALEWASGPLPADPRRLAKICSYDFEKFAVLWPTVSRQFQATDTGLINLRVEELREHAMEMQAKRIDASRQRSGGAREIIGTSTWSTRRCAI